MSFANGESRLFEKNIFGIEMQKDVLGPPETEKKKWIGKEKAIASHQYQSLSSLFGENPMIMNVSGL